jgi:hypothetical protein
MDRALRIENFSTGEFGNESGLSLLQRFAALTILDFIQGDSTKNLECSKDELSSMALLLLQPEPFPFGAARHYKSGKVFTVKLIFCFRAAGGTPRNETILSST